MVFSRRLALGQLFGLSCVGLTILLMTFIFTNLCLALGVGKKAAGGTTSSGPSSDRGGPTIIAGARPKATPVQTRSKAASATSGVTESPARSLGQSETVVGSTSSVKRVSQTSSALKSLMDQGQYTVCLRTALSNSMLCRWTCRDWTNKDYRRCSVDTDT